MNKQNDKKEGRKQNKDINTRTNKLAKIMLIVLIAIFTLATLIVLNRENIIELGDNINNLIERKNSELVNSEEKSVTNIDLTGLVTGEDTEHTHIYETITNDTEHWKQCIICNKKIDVEKHILGEKTWAAGSESCEKNNFYTQRCKCGYQIEGRKPCIWDGKSYLSGGSYKHVKSCSICKGQIENKEYYMENDPNTLYVSKPEQCANNKGKIICSNLGICDTCERDWTKQPHYLIANGKAAQGTTNIYCTNCKKHLEQLNLIQLIIILHHQPTQEILKLILQMELQLIQHIMAQLEMLVIHLKKLMVLEQILVILLLHIQYQVLLRMHGKKDIKDIT